VGRLKRFLSNPKKYLSMNYFLNHFIGDRLFLLLLNNASRIKNDKFYLHLFYRFGMKRKLDLNNPTTYTEKIQALKLLNTNPLYSILVDKYRVRDHVREKIGDEHLIPLIGVFDKFEDICFETLPNSFVLKTTHDSGTVIICKEKAGLDLEWARKKLVSSLSTNYFYRTREYPYKFAIPKIIAEKLIEQPNSESLIDYKFFCFRGKAEFLQITSQLNGKKYVGFYTLDFQLHEFQTHESYFDPTLIKPQNFENMIQIAEKLSAGIPHVRIDLYNVDGKIYFGEFTFHHNGGIIHFNPPIWDVKLGDKIIIPNISNSK